jgi:N-acetyl-gamma-glutamyl-phosphate reductase
MLVSIPLLLDTLPGCPPAAALREALTAHYAGSVHVSVADHHDIRRLQPEALNGTDRLELHVFADDADGHAILVARLDNLGKGASGAAVQNLRLMLGLEEPSP